jgi:hypothetical protein
MAAETIHAVLVIDDATTDDVRCVIRAVRSTAAESDCPAWPDKLAVIVRDAADELSEHVANIVSSSRLRTPSPTTVGLARTV